MITEATNGFNIEGNELTINCISSKENKFHLDSEGNLTVNSITTNENNTSANINVDSIYPVGSIYMNISLVDPAAIFGGVWERIAKGRTLVGVDEDDLDFNMVQKAGGSKYLQKHQHSISTGATFANGTEFPYFSAIVRENSGANITKAYNVVTTFDGIGESGNLQPYITCYMWKRIS